MKSVMIVGVGGQGTLLASRVLGRVMLDAGYDVKVSEVHGMSQRGGSVVTYVRWGERVESPVINEGEADILLAFEQLEAARYLPYLKKGGVVVTEYAEDRPDARDHRSGGLPGGAARKDRVRPACASRRWTRCASPRRPARRRP